MEINWITKEKLSKRSGLSMRKIGYMMSKGELDYKKTSSSKQGRVLISVSSFNKFFESLKIE